MVRVSLFSAVQHGLYLAAILASLADVLGLNRRWRLAIAGRRLFRSLVCALAVFLAFDCVGAARGWFFSDPRFSIAVLPPGVSLEEPFLLGFLAILSLALWRGARMLLR